MGMSIEELEQNGSKAEIFLQPLEKIHLYSDLIVEFEPNGDIKYVYIFSAIALFILILAIVNFMNLSTARSADRAKEVGIRKVMGSYRIYLIRQFLIESILYVLISIIISLALAQLILPSFNQLSGKNLIIPYSDPIFWILIAAGSILIGILSGIYPAIFLSSFKPVSILQGKITRGSKGSFIRSILVIFQFTISIILIIGTIGVYNQLHFIQNKKLGFNKDQVIIIRDAYAMGDQVQSFRNELVKLEDIESGTVSGFLPISNSNRSNTTLWKKGDRSPESSVNMQKWRVDQYYIPTFDMKIVKGRMFSPDIPSDSSAIIINEEAAKLFGFEDPIGQEIETFAFNNNNTIDEKNTVTYKIIGIVENFHFESLREGVGALSMILSQNNGMVSFKYHADQTTRVIEEIRSKWNEIAPGQPFTYSFLDDEFGQMYEAEQRTGEIFTAFAILAILIASLGLFALAAFMTEQRTKEIGIRKVMGATMSNIVYLLSKDFSKLVIIAFAISIPIAWYGINLWLEGFAYKNVPGVAVYILSGFVALAIAGLTVSYQSIKAASNNPAQSLRDE
jgi:putative ABC transport system permease protein